MPKSLCHSADLICVLTVYKIGAAWVFFRTSPVIYGSFGLIYLQTAPTSTNFGKTLPYFSVLNHAIFEDQSNNFHVT